MANQSGEPQRQEVPRHLLNDPWYVPPQDDVKEGAKAVSAVEALNALDAAEEAAPLEITWKEVEQGDTVRGKDGNGWLISHVGPHSEDGYATFRMEFAGTKHSLRLPLNQGVWLLAGGKMADQAAALVAIRLGGRPHAMQDGSGNWICPLPEDYPTVGSLQAHIYLFHGQTVDSQDFASVKRYHERLHDTQVPGDRRLQPHVHTEDFRSDVVVPR